MTPSPASEVVRHPAAPPGPAGGAAKRSYVRSLFTAIAPRYDFLNHLLSLNVARSWRLAAEARLGLEASTAGAHLVLCAGILVLAAVLARARAFTTRGPAADFYVS